MLVALLIACLMIHQFGFHWWWYVFAVWLFVIDVGLRAHQVRGVLDKKLWPIKDRAQRPKQTLQ